MFEEKKILGTILYGLCLATYQCKLIIENCNSSGAGAHKVGILNIREKALN